MNGYVYKSTEDLTASDFVEWPVWEYVQCDERWVRPVVELPVDSLRNRLVGTKVRVHSGKDYWGVLSNVSLRNPRRTAQYITLWIEKDGVWFELARYFDVDYHRRGPTQLACFLGMSEEDVFPITYDISQFATGDEIVVKGKIPSQPPERLTEDELIELSLSDE